MVMMFIRLLQVTRMGVCWQEGVEERVSTALVLVVRRYVEVVRLPLLNIPKPPHFDRTIASFPAQDCWGKFRTKKEDLQRLFDAYRMPEYVKTSNRLCFTGEEAFLFALHRYSSLSTLEQISVNTFGRDETQWSRALTWFSKHVWDTFADKLIDNLEYWLPYFPMFAEKIRLTLIRKARCFFSQDQFAIAAFIDAKCWETCSVGSGPAEEGTDALRWDSTLQRAFYTGWLGVHGLKWQTVQLPNGMTADMFGPATIRHNDRWLQRESEINDRLADVQAGQVRQFSVYGDAEYVLQSHIKRRHGRANLVLPPRLQEEDDAMKKMRIGNEWDYGTTANLYPHVHFHKNMKILQAKDVSTRYFVATLFKNCHVCLYGSQSAQYFDCPPPSLEDYMG
eukprot:Lithocolla_globosa_v1_NODE_1598_length_2457_cov_74.169858.p1 type:complete len:393 gc:universal NODE_1598_length_2457_cov_74.169858:1075-2253(+)